MAFCTAGRWHFVQQGKPVDLVKISVQQVERRGTAGKTSSLDVISKYIHFVH